MKITERCLERHNAPSGQVSLFAETFAEGADITLDNLLKAARAGLDVDGLARSILSGRVFSAYMKATDRARAVYSDAEYVAWVTFDRATEHVCAEGLASAWQAYDDEVAPALTAFRQAAARALWDQWRVEGVR